MVLVVVLQQVFAASTYGLESLGSNNDTVPAQLGLSAHKTGNCYCDPAVEVAVYRLTLVILQPVFTASVSVLELPVLIVPETLRTVGIQKWRRQL